MNGHGDAASLPGPLVVIAGPTATGKTSLSLDVAEALGGEIVNTDSMQLYRGMDIGTAKVPVDQRRGIPHHLLDIWDVRSTANVAAYQALARSRVDELLARGRTPVLVGGSGLYIQAVVEDLEFPGTDPDLRAELEAELERIGPAALHERLASVDADAAAVILPSNGRRIVRALEVVSLTGSFAARLPDPKPLYRAVSVAVDRDTTELDERIERRVDLMWTDGLVDEVESLLKQGLADGVTASRAIGYRQVIGQLAGDIDEVEAKRQTVVGTRRFVRRQRSWFRRHERYSWFDGADPDIAHKVLSMVSDDA
ncbi:tRNA (adenosine(37)-N6)-dimethylallyltransferase MiaA [Stackebrandtia soli]|uniref:tRNA (adenosine(37)-N6)-dimethylallyltransferase MiaA n=1 Tax=Stackebrandtia soli TaxID=1892856 RepID=UPI0039E9E8E5